MNRFSKRLLLASAMLSGAMWSAQAHAQAASDVEEVIVTGSRIKRVDISGVGPATVVSQEEISNTGITNVETLLARLPASAGAAGSQTSAYWTGNGYGTAQVNLRGLGINRTLTLINGRRVVNGGTGANSAPDLKPLMGFAFGSTVYRLRAGLVEDPYSGEMVPGNWNDPEVLPIPGAFVAATSTSRLGDATREKALEAKFGEVYGL